jgi:hypothetical protein
MQARKATKNKGSLVLSPGAIHSVILWLHFSCDIYVVINVAATKKGGAAPKQKGRRGVKASQDDKKKTPVYDPSNPDKPLPVGLKVATKWRDNCYRSS